MKKNEFCRWHYQKKFRKYPLILLGLLVSLISVLISGGVSLPFFIIAIFAVTVGDVFLYRRIFTIEWHFKKKINENLDWFCKQNNFIKTHTEKEKDRNGDSYTVECIDYSPGIFYKIGGSNIYVDFRLDGSLISKNFDSDMGVRLGNLLGYEMLEVNADNAFIRFTYAKERERRLYVNHNNIGTFVSHDGYKISLTSRLSWQVNKASHLLCVGGTGSGKSMLLFYLLSAFYAGGAEIKVCDPKMSDLSQTGFVFGQDNIAVTPAQIAKILREAEEEMNRRYAYMNEHNAEVGFGKDFTAFSLVPQIVCIDELMALVAGSSDKKLVDEIKKRILSLVVKGRAAGVFIWVALQRADASFIDGAVRDNLGVRILLGNSSADGNTMVFGSEYRNLSLTSSEKGAGFIYVDGLTASPCPFTTPYVSNVVGMLTDAANERKARVVASGGSVGHGSSGDKEDKKLEHGDRPSGATQEGTSGRK